MEIQLTFPIMAIICSVGFAVGIFGAVMGSTLFVLVPLLTTLGLPIQAAIGTAKVSVVGRDMAPLAYFRGQGMVDWRAGLLLTITALITAQAGAYCAVWLHSAALERIVGLCMLLMASATFLNPRAGLAMEQSLTGGSRTVKSMAVGIIIGFYTGIFGGGANLLIVFALVYLSGQTFLSAVANSKLPNLIITAASLPILIAAGYVNWAIAIPLTLATAAGAALGARLVVNQHNRTLRILFQLLIVVLALRYIV